MQKGERGRISLGVGLRQCNDKLTGVQVPDVDLAVQRATDSKLRRERILFHIQTYEEVGGVRQGGKGR